MNLNNIKIFVLVGGFGTRLKNIVSDVPKPMAPINKKPFLAYKIEMIQKYLPENQIYLLTHYMSDIIEEFFKDNKKIIVIKEDQPLGTGGSLKNAITYLNLKDTEKIIVMNGDTYIQPDYIDFINNATEDINMMTNVIHECDKFNTVEIENNRVTKFRKKENNVYDLNINTGCYLFNKINMIKNIPGKIFSLEQKFSEMVESIIIKSYPYDGIFIDIGTPDDYLRLINEKNNENK